jgi:hypothetical protein
MKKSLLMNYIFSHFNWVYIFTTSFPKNHLWPLGTDGMTRIQILQEMTLNRLLFLVEKSTKSLTKNTRTYWPFNIFLALAHLAKVKKFWYGKISLTPNDKVVMNFQVNRDSKSWWRLLTFTKSLSEMRGREGKCEKTCKKSAKCWTRYVCHRNQVP